VLWSTPGEGDNTSVDIGVAALTAKGVLRCERRRERDRDREGEREREGTVVNSEFWYPKARHRKSRHVQSRSFLVSLMGVQLSGSFVQCASQAI